MCVKVVFPKIFPSFNRAKDLDKIKVNIFLLWEHTGSLKTLLKKMSCKFILVYQRKGNKSCKLKIMFSYLQTLSYPENSLKFRHDMKSSVGSQYLLFAFHFFISKMYSLFPKCFMTQNCLSSL